MKKDSDLFEELNKYKWFKSSNGYVRRTTSEFKFNNKFRTAVCLHNKILNIPKGFVVDHKNKCRIDNTKRNLLICPINLNVHRNSKKLSKTSSKFKGVSLYKSSQKWESEIRVNGKRIFLGCYENELDAAKAYNRAALRHYGENAYQNKLD